MENRNSGNDSILTTNTGNTGSKKQKAAEKKQSARQTLGSIGTITKSIEQESGCISKLDSQVM